MLFHCGFKHMLGIPLSCRNHASATEELQSSTSNWDVNPVCCVKYLVVSKRNMCLWDFVRLCNNDWYNNLEFLQYVLLFWHTTCLAHFLHLVCVDWSSISTIRPVSIDIIPAPFRINILGNLYFIPMDYPFLGLSTCCVSHNTFWRLVKHAHRVMHLFIVPRLDWFISLAVSLSVDLLMSAFSSSSVSQLLLKGMVLRKTN